MITMKDTNSETPIQDKETSSVNYRQNSTKFSAYEKDLHFIIFLLIVFVLMLILLLIVTVDEKPTLIEKT